MKQLAAGALGGLLALLLASSASALTRSSASAIALEQAAEVGTVESGEVVHAISVQARGLLSPGETIPAATESRPVSIVVLHGHFVDTLASVPHGYQAPTGSAMTFTIGEDGHVLETGVTNKAPQLSTLGVVAPVPTSSVASAARAHVASRRVDVVRKHAGAHAHAATWGSNCKVAEAHHCYGIAEWAMTGSEQVEGDGFVVDTTTAEEPGWESGQFVDHETWASWKSSGEWVEIGQEAGNFKACCTMYPFWAYKNGEGYKQHTEYGGISMNQWNSYTMLRGGTDEWCFYFPGSWKVGCVGDLTSNYANDLQDGVEMASEAEPPNAGSAETDYSAVGGEVRAWNKATRFKVPEGAEKICVTDYRPGGRAAVPGDINFGTC
jgi:hypothetical protein